MDRVLEWPPGVGGARPDGANDDRNGEDGCGVTPFGGRENLMPFGKTPPTGDEGPKRTDEMLAE